MCEQVLQCLCFGFLGNNLEAYKAKLKKQVMTMRMKEIQKIEEIIKLEEGEDEEEEEEAEFTDRETTEDEEEEEVSNAWSISLTIDGCYC